MCHLAVRCARTTHPITKANATAKRNTKKQQRAHDAESEYNASQAYTESEYSPTTHVSSESRSVRVPTIFPVFLNPDADSHEHATKKNEFVEKNNVRHV